MTAETAERPVVYCLVPRELAERLHEPLRDHFAADSGVEVVVERRRTDRRSGAERRRTGADAAGEVAERRKIQAGAGRRVGERRARLAEVAEAPPLPRRARRHAARLSFVRRLEPSGLGAEDGDTARLIVRFQGGEREIFATLYARYFDRIFGYMRVAVNDRAEAEDLTQEVFAEMLAALPRYERREQPFRSWMYTIVRNTAIKHMRKQRRVELVGDGELARCAEAQGEGEEGGPDDEASLDDLSALDWIADRDLLLFVERLPAEQRQAIVMRFVLGMSAPQIADELGASPEAIRAQQSRALRFLRDRLTAIGRAPARGQRPAPSLSPIRPMTVLRERRFGLYSPGPR